MSFLRLAALRLPLLVAALLVLLWQGLRIVLVVEHRTSIISIAEGVRVFLSGLHLDIVAALCVVTPFALWAVLKKRPWAGAAEVARWPRCFSVMTCFRKASPSFKLPTNSTPRANTAVSRLLCRLKGDPRLSARSVNRPVAVRLVRTTLC
jgi:hypothetical protein